MRSNLGQQDRAWLSLHLVETEEIRRVQEADLLQAARHYRRALAALEGESFEYLSIAITRKLQNHLQTSLTTIENELRRRDLVYAQVESGAMMD